MLKIILASILEIEAFKILAQAGGRLGKNLWLAHGAVQRPVWNGRFGPPQRSADHDVAVVGPAADCASVEAELRRVAPQLRWACHPVIRRVGGAVARSFDQYLGSKPLVWRRCAIRLSPSSGEPELALGPGAEQDLMDGVLRLDEEALERMSSADRQSSMEEGLWRARKAVQEYPGLRPQGLLAQLYEARFGPPRFVDCDRLVMDDQAAVQEAVLAMEGGAGGRQVWRGLASREAEAAQEVLAFYRTVRREGEAPPAVALAPLPPPLEEAREAGLCKGVVVPPPVGYASWLHYAASEATDASWREWLAGQWRSQLAGRQPWGGADLVVGAVQSLDIFQAYLGRSRGRSRGEQKPTHQGWPLENHLLGCALQVSTDHLEGVAEAAGLGLPAVRLGLRMAALFHDGGKLLNCHTPGGHEAQGARLFSLLRPTWLPWLGRQEAGLAQWAIATHDGFGRLSRGLVEKPGVDLHDPGFDTAATPRYRGALDPEAVREEALTSGFSLEVALPLNKAIWVADVGSVAALRWLLPVADRVEKVILAGA